MIFDLFKLSTFFKKELILNYHKNKGSLENKKKINYINIYHKNWPKNKEFFLKNLIDNEIKCKNIISFGFINSPINCQKQKFHLDYNSYTHTYFIPLIDLNDCNGTEYIQFYDTKINIKNVKNLLGISNKYLFKNDIINELKKIDLHLNKDYEFKYLNAKAFDVILMKNYIFHRGSKNRLNVNRVMFQIVCGINKNVNIIDSVKIIDAELDEKDFCKETDYKEKWCKEMK